MKRIANALGQLSCGKKAYVVVVLCATTAIASPAQTLTTLHSFNGTDGQAPTAALVQATNGDLYGTTYNGGANGAGLGTVFKVTPSGTLTTLHSFAGYPTDGALPYAALVQATNGYLYGTAYNGGANGAGDGMIFKITPSGTLTTLYNFCSQYNGFTCTDGNGPYGELIQAGNRNLYGTTLYGGTHGNGTVFKITPSGMLTVLYSFCSHSGCTDGANPWAGLVQAANANFYGTTAYGGANGNYGTVFRITPSGTLTVLYSFCSQSGCTDGANPWAGLVQAADGNFYGTTRHGGANGHGTVFKITPSGTLTTLHSFCSQSGCTDGDQPAAGLVPATSGDLYGTTLFGGTSTNCSGACGTVFKITPSGTLTTLYSFDGADGYGPNGLVQATNGRFYGTAGSGGAYGDGTVFSLSVGLGPFVKTLPTSGEAGAAVKILGSLLTGATSVSFNGTAATFTVVSRYLITTTVPAGATTGKVQVVTPSGALSSNVPFRVP